jgi:energy-coupling factor transporter transmembrane protein EcfT
MALEARGFGRQTPRTTFVRSRFVRHDMIAATVIVTVVVVYVWAAMHGYGKIRRQ